MFKFPKGRKERQMDKNVTTMERTATTGRREQPKTQSVARGEARSQTGVRSDHGPQTRQQEDWRDQGTVCPATNIFESDNEYLLELEMPGVKKEGLDISVEGNELLIV